MGEPLMLPEALAQLVREVGGDALLLDARRGRALVSDTTQLLDLLKRLRNAGFTRLIDFTGVHIEAGTFQLLLTLRAPEHNHAALTLKWKYGMAPAAIDNEAPPAGYNGEGGAGQPGGQPLQAGSVAHPTLSQIWPAAGLAEREIFEMLGIPFSGNENLAPLLLEEQFPGFPLRRDFKPPAREKYADALLKDRVETTLLDALVGAGLSPAQGGSETRPYNKDEQEDGGAP
jgi:NADH:ubiquinone oxidoreductase subunit C